MTPIVVICIAVTALCIGYHYGRRAGSTPSTWRKRTSRTARRAALSVILLMIARRVQRNSLARHALSNAVGVWALRFAEPLRLLRSGLPLQRFH